MKDGGTVDLYPNKRKGGFYMDTDQIVPTMNQLIKKMKGDGYSDNTLDHFLWIGHTFETFCVKRNIQKVNSNEARNFFKESFDFDLDAPNCQLQFTLRRPVLLLFEFYHTGNYLLRHHNTAYTNIPTAFLDFYLEYKDFVDNLITCQKQAKKNKLWTMGKFLLFLDKNRVYSFRELSTTLVHQFINSLESSPNTKDLHRGNLRQAIDWMFDKQICPFSGYSIFPVIHSSQRLSILSYYSKEDMRKAFDVIDINSVQGKLEMAVITTLYYTGIRASDLLEMTFAQLDWENDVFFIRQKKSGEPLTLPLLPEMKFALLDYIKNSRKAVNEDLDHIFLISCAPYHKFSIGGISSIVKRVFLRAEIDITGKHAGAHAMRHSLATNLMQESVPISAISNVLGHKQIRSTEKYLTIDETKLREFSLEVPYVFL
ncbi:hypothetical protein RV10_GL005104 [Enterococcus pallens]|nr:hypothetical protein RV10_GL005104 [Enterococcus pallens]